EHRDGCCGREQSFTEHFYLIPQSKEFKSSPLEAFFPARDGSKRAAQRLKTPAGGSLQSIPANSQREEISNGETFPETLVREDLTVNRPEGQ
ncbi:MAG TPA: hypothetical protein VE713_08340, partial [Pyrinomonadaceae bacterium]|nr:hypothetical protein [Pyrinomonadaceae bacterium]